MFAYSAALSPSFLSDLDDCEMLYSYSPPDPHPMCLGSRCAAAADLMPASSRHRTPLPSSISLLCVLCPLSSSTAVGWRLNLPQSQTLHSFHLAIDNEIAETLHLRSLHWLHGKSDYLLNTFLFTAGLQTFRMQSGKSNGKLFSSHSNLLENMHCFIKYKTNN